MISTTEKCGPFIMTKKKNNYYHWQNGNERLKTGTPQLLGVLFIWSKFD